MRGSKIDVEDKVLVAVGTNEGDAEVTDWGGKGVGEGLEGGAEGVHDCQMPGRLARGGECSIELEVAPKLGKRILGPKNDRLRPPYGAKAKVGAK